MSEHPLFSGDRILGVILLFTSHHLSANVLAGLKTIAQILVFCIERIHILRFTKQNALHWPAMLDASSESTRSRSTSEDKNDFVATVAHELLVPVNSILAMCRGLQSSTDDPLTEKQAENAKTIESCVIHMHSVISDLLDIARINANRLQIHEKSVVVADVCREAMRVVDALAKSKGILTMCEVDESITNLVTDKKRLTQILVNLLVNAVKFTLAGGMVRLEVSPDSTHSTIRFDVVDTGIGIASADIPRLFRPFERMGRH
jgi:signal transduction histidine kinase